jgi:hypothetical protein
MHFLLSYDTVTYGSIPLQIAHPFEGGTLTPSPVGTIPRLDLQRDSDLCQVDSGWTVLPALNRPIGEHLLGNALCLAQSADTLGERLQKGT